MINNLDEFTAASVIQLVESIEPGSGGSLKVLIPMMSCHEVVKIKRFFMLAKKIGTNTYYWMDCSDL